MEPASMRAEMSSVSFLNVVSSMDSRSERRSLRRRMRSRSRMSHLAFLHFRTRAEMVAALEVCWADLVQRS